MQNNIRKKNRKIEKILKKRKLIPLQSSFVISFGAHSHISLYSNRWVGEKKNRLTFSIEIHLFTTGIKKKKKLKDNILQFVPQRDKIY